MVAIPDPNPTELERIASALETIDATIHELAGTLLAEAGVIADLSQRFAVVEQLLERYQPLLTMAEQRINGGRLGGLRGRGVPRAQNARETESG